MAEFLSREALCERLGHASFDRPPALVANAHVTGLGVARALAAHDVPVIAVDRTDTGVAPPSTAVEFAGRVSYPLEDPDGFRADLEALADAAGTELVAFGCMDEWVHGLADTEPEGVELASAGRAAIDAVLDKSALYRLAEELGVPYPETRWLAETAPADAAEQLGLPLVVKPAFKREFEEAVGTNVLEVATLEELREIVETAREADIELLAQETVPVAPGEDASLASYVPPAGVEEALSVVGNARLRQPRGYGTSCVVETADVPVVEERALAVLEATGYHGISEAEFVYDGDREEYVLLDVNTRPWKWIGLPVAAGANLPMAAYATATGVDYDPGPTGAATWVSLADYLRGLAAGAPDVLDPVDWRAFLSGSFLDRPDLTAAVYRPDDPGPAHRLLGNEVGGAEYYCAC
jgi:predicted ATP-grasp superfamily ATP-dependent carboligase